MGFLDFLFPKWCVSCKVIGSYLCTNCFAYLSFNEQNMCLVCGKGSIDGFTHPVCKTRFSIDGMFSALIYKGAVKRLIYQFKYKPYVTDLRFLLGDLFYESLIQKEGFMRILEKNPVLVPIPLHSSKLKSRGYNHAGILADELAKRFKITIVNLLIRIRKTSSQFGLNREERKENVDGAFAISSDKQPFGLAQYGQAIRDKYIFLVDDIVTTGATLNEAARVLKIAGVQKVWGISLSKD